MGVFWSGGTHPRVPRHVVIQYFHPLDECRNGGMRWTAVFDEIAPGLIDIRHPNCSTCFAEPMIDSRQVVDGEAPKQEGGFVPWPEVKEKLATAREKRQPHRETEPVYDDGRFDQG